MKIKTIALILAAGENLRHGGESKAFLTHPSGETLAHYAAESVIADEKILVTLKGGPEVRIGLKVLEIDPQQSQVESAVEAIKKLELGREQIFLKDCDCATDPVTHFGVDTLFYGNAEGNECRGKDFIVEENGVVKSFERKGSGVKFSCGTYAFRTANYFLGISENISTPGQAFVGERCEEASGYSDWNTMKLYNQFVSRHSAYFVDIDGTLLTSAGGNKAPFWFEDQKPLFGNIRTVKYLIESGARIIFTTSRPECHRYKTKKQLMAMGFVGCDIIMGLPCAPRVLINDRKRGSWLPTAKAIQVERNKNELQSLLIQSGLDYNG